MTEKTQKTGKLTQLQWWDVLIVSVILFGGAIWNSTQTFLTVPSEILEQGSEFTAMDNWLGIFTILLELSVGWLYLRWRNFDFYQWKYKPTWKATLAAVGIFLVMSLGMDVVSILSLGWREATAYVGGLGILDVLKEMDASLLIFSFMNGIYEEIFFLGVCTAVPKKQRKGVLIYSLAIRFSFHTYQGIASALGIGFVIGGLYLLFYYKNEDRNLYPYMLSHAFADVFGAGLLYLV